MHFTTCNQHKMTRHKQNLQFLSLIQWFWTSLSLCNVFRYPDDVCNGWSKWQRASPCLLLLKHANNNNKTSELMFALHIRNRLFSLWKTLFHLSINRVMNAPYRFGLEWFTMQCRAPSGIINWFEYIEHLCTCTLERCKSECARKMYNTSHLITSISCIHNTNIWFGALLFDAMQFNVSYWRTRRSNAVIQLESCIKCSTQFIDAMNCTVHLSWNPNLVRLPIA